MWFLLKSSVYQQLIKNEHPAYCWILWMMPLSYMFHLLYCIIPITSVCSNSFRRRSLDTAILFWRFLHPPAVQNHYIKSSSRLLYIHYKGSFITTDPQQTNDATWNDDPEALLYASLTLTLQAPAILPTGYCWSWTMNILLGDATNVNMTCNNLDGVWFNDQITCFPAWQRLVALAEKNVPARRLLKQSTVKYSVNWKSTVTQILSTHHGLNDHLCHNGWQDLDHYEFSLLIMRTIFYGIESLEIDFLGAQKLDRIVKLYWYKREKP